ncbi:MAG TPA: putative Ig domain-containing protein [Bryobacteraceae bacterium]|nr:putative Ig domain-containing protein [Bryobacteraceae bacterium]
MNSRKNFLAALAVILGLAMVVSGCSGGKPPIAITLGPSGAQNVAAGQTANITATVSNDPKAAGVAWSLTGPGTLSAQTSTSVTYTAPSPISANATATVTATSLSDSTKTATLTINLQAVSIALTPSAAQTDEQGKATSVTAAVSNDPMTKGVTWSLTGAGALSGQTATAVTYTAPASITTASTATITATSVFDTTKTTTLTINLVPPPSVTTPSLAAGTVGTAYSATLAAANGVAPYAWSVTVGTLPPGLTLAATGAITGTPTAFGTSSFTVQVKDADNFTATAALSIKINPAPVVVTTSSLPNGIVNTPGYSATLQSTGGAAPITWTVTAGALPTGLTLAATGAITGTPTTAGTSNFSVTATDSSSPGLTATKALSITIVPVLSITTSSLPNGVTSAAYSATLQSTGGVAPITWSVSLGALPAGLSLNPSTGAITGSPTAAGTTNFTVQAADSGAPQQKVTKALSITVVQQLVITTASLPTGAVNSVYAATAQSTGGVAPITWSISLGALPPGLAINTSTGAITGTPTTAGTSSFTVQAADSGAPQQTATKQFNIIVNPVLAISTTSLPSGTVGTAYSQSLQTNGGGITPIAWSITLGSLPPGLTLNAGTGVISGTPTTGTGSPFNFTVRAADSGTPQQTSSQALSISIATAPLSVATTGLPNGVVGQSYNGAILQSAGGNPPVTWSISVGALPAGLTLNASSGAITGSPSAAGTTTFTVKATDSTSPTAQNVTKQLSILVNPVLSITTPSLPSGTVGAAYSATLQSSGGATPITWSVSSGSLPPGLSLVPGTGVISGTPSTNSGSPFNFTVQATDSTTPTAQTATANLSITVTVATLVVTTTSGSLPNGTVNTAYPNANLSASGGIPPYTWILTGGTNLPAGLSLSSSGQITGTPTATGTTNFTVQVSDSATPTANTATAGLSITVSAAPTCTTGGSESLLNGQYAFVLKGFDNGTGTGETSPQPALIGGVLTFNGSGGITAGAMDMNLNSGVQTNLAVTSGSSFYHVTSDQRGCMVLTTSAGTQNYRFSLGNITSGVAATGHVIDFDSAGPFTAGELRKQTASAFSTSQVTGNYAFGVSSAQNSAQCNDNNVCGGNFGAVGVLDFSTGSVNGGSLDFNFNGELDNTVALTTWPGSPVSINSGGTYSISATNGRGTMSFTPAGVSTAVNEVIYVVSATDVLILGIDNQTGNNIFAGEALQQSGAPFIANPLSGFYVGYDTGIGSGGSGTSRTDIILLGPQSSGTNTLTGTQLRNDTGTFKSSAISGTYSVISTGRMTTSGGGSSSPILFLASLNQAFFLNSNGGVDSGFFQSQTGAPFTNTSASGTYAFGTIDPLDANSGDSVGVATFTPATTAISIINDNNGNGSQSLGQTQSLNYSVDSTGLGMIPSTGSSCAITATSTTCQTLFYVISPTKAVVMDTQSSNPKTQLADK